MSTFFSHSVACKRCGLEALRKVAHSLNAERRPDLRREIVERRFQNFPCDGCGGHVLVERPFFYFDEPSGLWCGVYPSEWEKDWQAHEEAIVAAFEDAMVRFAPPIVQATAAKFRVRAVFGVHALAEKLVAHDAGIDDTALEALKLEMLRRSEGQLHVGQRPRLVAATDEILSLDIGDAEIEVPRALLHTTSVEHHRAVGGRAYVDARRAFTGKGR